MTRGQVWEGATKREGLLNEAMGTVGPKKKIETTLEMSNASGWNVWEFARILKNCIP